jgi:hypothetical protein
MAAMVRCIGTEDEWLSEREFISGAPACGWVGEMPIAAEEPWCPQCHTGRLESVETSGAEAVVSATTTPTMRGRSASAPERHGDAQAQEVFDTAEAVGRLRSMASGARVALSRGHWRDHLALQAGADALEQADHLCAIELAAVALLRASGSGASWGDHESAERVLRDLLTTRGHDLGEGAA